MLLEFGGDNDADALSGEKTTALQRSWAMSTRTKTILDTVSSSKALHVENITEMHQAEHQQMESVAIYMYTLVQCYKIDESLRLAQHTLSLHFSGLYTHRVGMSICGQMRHTTR